MQHHSNVECWANSNLHNSKRFLSPFGKVSSIFILYNWKRFQFPVRVRVIERLLYKFICCIHSREAVRRERRELLEKLNMKKKEQHNGKVDVKYDFFYKFTAVTGKASFLRHGQNK